jgi:hypothetical protein
MIVANRHPPCGWIVDPHDGHTLAVMLEWTLHVDSSGLRQCEGSFTAQKVMTWRNALLRKRPPMITLCRQGRDSLMIWSGLAYVDAFLNGQQLSGDFIAAQPWMIPTVP